jgi:hypothetical protein
MKKNTLITSAIAALVGLTAFTYQNPGTTYYQDAVYENTNEIVNDEPVLTFFYDYGPRFKGILKARIKKATSITDIYLEEDLDHIVSYGKVSLVVIENERQSEIKELSEGTLLTEAQLQLLRSLDYSASFNLRADCKRYNEETGELEDGFHSPHLTIVPEKQTEYNNGKEALLKFLAEGSQKEKAIAQKRTLRPAKLYFTVTKKGTIANVKIGNHSDCKVLDDKMIELLKTLPGKWTPAENHKGEKISQELVVSYGFEGC